MLRIALLALIAALAFSSSGARVARAADPATAGTLRLAVPLDPHTLMPLLVTEFDESEVAGLMFDSLLRFNGRNQPEPVLASAVPTRANGGISASGTAITFHLRHGVRWQDGAPFTAADVVFTIHAILDDRNNVNNRVDYANIVSVTALDPFTVRFTLKTPQASFLSDVGDGYPIVPAHVLEKSTNLATDPFAANPVGTGAYRFVRWQRGDRIELDANPSYVLGAPKMPHVVVSIVPDSNTLGVELREHELDFSTVESSTFNALEGAPGIVRTTEPQNDAVLLAVNQTRPLMRDRRVREAIAAAIDKRRLVQTLTHGVGIIAYADLPFFMYDGHGPAGWEEPDPTRSRALLDAAGWHVGPNGMRTKNGVPLRVEYIDYSGSASAASADAQISDMLRAVGIDTSIKTFAPSLYFQPASAGGPLRSGSYDLASTGFTAGTDPDNKTLYSCATRIPNGNNLAGYCSPAMEALQAASEREYDPAARKRIIARIEDLAVHDVAYIALYHTPHRFVQSPALRRPPSNLTGYWFGIEQWSLAGP